MSVLNAPEVEHTPFDITTELARIDLDVVYTFLSRQSHWAHGMSRAMFERSVAHSMCFGAFDRRLHAGGVLCGFARVVTDHATFAWLCDVFTLPPFRGRGVAVALVGAVHAHPALAEIRRRLLFTRDAHALYAKFGYVPTSTPERVMEIRTAA